MGFPVDPLDIVVKLGIDANLTADPSTWMFEDITSYVLHRDGVTISRGRADEAGQADPSKCVLSLRNLAGRFTRFNPLSPYYGRLGKNAPLLVQVRRLNDTFSRTASSGWGVATSGQTWTTSGGSSSDPSVSAGQGILSLGSVNVIRHALADAGVRDGTVTADITNPVLPTGAAITHWLIGRAQDASNYYTARLSIATSGTVTLALLSRIGGTVSSALASTTVGTHAAGDTWRVVFDLEGGQLRARAWRPAADVMPGWQVTATSTVLTSGTMWGRGDRLETGNSNSLPVQVTTDDLSVCVTRFAGHVSEWPPRWDISGHDQWVPIEANGTLRRLGQGASSLQSPLRRAIGASAPIAYWPCEDGETASAPASALIGRPPMKAIGTVQFGRADGMPGSLPLVSLAGTGRLVGPVPPGTGTSWRAECVYRVNEDLGGAEPDVLTLKTGATYWSITAIGDFGVGLFLSYGTRPDSVGVTLDSTSTSNTGVVTDRQWHHLRLDVAQSGANISVTITIDGVVAATDTYVGFTLERPDTVFANWFQDEAPLPDVGHYAVWAPYNPPTAVDTAAAAKGHAGELASARIARLCAEEGVPVTVTAGTSEAMGTQSVTTLLDLLRECEAADGGYLYETPRFGLGYQPRTARYNATTTLALTYGDLVPPFEPADDDQRVRNDWTVERTGGSRAQVVDATHIAANGRYASSATLNVATDGVLANHAGWRVHLGTVDELRYPAVAFDLAARPSLIGAWLATDLGARLAVSNQPADLPPGQIGAFIEGYEERLGFYTWGAALNTSPASPWTVAVLDDAVLGKLDTDGSVLRTGVTSSGTTLDVAVTAGPLWTVDDAQFPFDVRVGGERITVTDITPPASPTFQTGAAAHAANASVSPTLPASVQADDLLLLFAAIRNSGAGVPQAPAGWTRLSVFEPASNAQLFARIATSSESAPTVTFSGGVANATTSARIVRFRGGKYHDVNRIVHRAADCLNGSAQDIAYPGLAVDIPTCLILYLGWKQDDWTGVATLAGASEVMDDPSATGDDQGIVMDRIIQTTPAAIAPGTFVVTGGASAISRGAVVAIADDRQTWTVTRAVDGVVKGHAAGAQVRLWTPSTLAL